jgi:hypothetical protein
MCGFTLEPTFSIVTEFVPGGSLWDFLRKHPRTLSSSQRTMIAYGIAHGMRSLHRDLKSCNILMAPGSIVRIADFGLGTFVDGAQQTVTRAAGTAQWMAPEQVFTKSYGLPVDVYAFGTVLFELLTEQIPFHGMKQADIYRMLQQGKRPVVPVEFADSDVYELIYRCWEKEPGMRPRFEEICDEFEAGVLVYPGTAPAELRSIVHYARKRDGSWIWNARQFGMRVMAAGGESPEERVFAAAADGDIQAFAEAFVRTEMDVNARNANGMAPLHLAVICGRPLMVTFLLGVSGIDPNLLTPDGTPPVILAPIHRQLECLEAMLACEAVDVNLPNARGDSLVHVLIYCRRTQDWRVFAMAGRKADLARKGAGGKTPKQLAIEFKWQEVAASLPDA